MANTSESAIVLDQVELVGSHIAMVVIVVLLVAVGLRVMLTMIRNIRDIWNMWMDGRRRMNWLRVVITLFSGNILDDLLIGVAGMVAAAGISVGAFNWNAMIILTIPGCIFAPTDTATGVITMPENMFTRFVGQGEYWCYAIPITNSSESSKVLDQVELKGSAMVVLFLFLKIAVELWAVFTLIRNNRGIVNGFVMAGRNIHRFAVGACLLSGEIGKGFFVGVAGMGAAAGIAVGAFDWNAMIILVLLGWIFAPIYTSTGVTTIPEYTRGRSGGQRIRIYLSVLPLFVYIFTSVSVSYTRIFNNAFVKFTFRLIPVVENDALSRLQQILKYRIMFKQSFQKK